jgi:hypothetical protein
MTRQYLIGELSVRLEQLQATTGRAAPDVHACAPRWRPAR